MVIWGGMPWLLAAKLLTIGALLGLIWVVLRVARGLPLWQHEAGWQRRSNAPQTDTRPHPAE
jgi:hypothetical protein